MRRLLLSLCLAFTLFLSALSHAEVQVDFWVWHRTKPLSETERATLPTLGTKTLYWHVGEMQNRTGQWRWKTPPRPTTDLAPGHRLVPVVRLTCEARQPFPPASLPKLRDDLVKVAGASGTLQLDYDCPDRLLPEYAATLRELRKSIPHLSITALTNWPRLPGFTALTGAVEEIAPMFYDLQGDPTGVSADAPPPPLLDPAQFEAVLQPWKSCPIPWRAGLPTFARVTVFDRTGLSRGQIPNWTWDDLCFHKSLHTLAPTRLGVTLLRAGENTRVASTVVAKDELVASRFTDRAALSQAIALVRAANPAGIILFRLPDNTGPAGWSLNDLAQINTASRPQFILRRTSGDQLELINDSAVDLPPRLSGEKSDRDRGYALELDAPAPPFREALAGDFWRVTAHARPDAEKPVAVVIPLATRLTYWFSQLPGRATLQTGLLQLAPGSNLDTLRYRIVAGKDAGEWKPLAPATANSTTP
jgi:hypothetical protein